MTLRTSRGGSLPTPAVLGDVDQLEGLDRLRLAVFGDLEVFLRQIVNGVALPVGDDDVDADEVDVGAEDRGLLLGLCAAAAAARRCWAAGAFCACSPAP